ncbi:ATP-binding cassette domain-containing protein [Verrucomicrobiota bacterium]
MSGDAAFSIDGLTIATPKGDLLFRDVSLAVQQGQILLLVGSSGKGKSTLLRLLAGVLRKGRWGMNVRGTLAVGGTELDLHRTTPRLGGYVFQEYALFDELTCAMNVAISSDHTPTPGSTPSTPGALLDKINMERTPHGMSGGEKQRVAIARTLKTDCPVLLFDEPNSGLDMNNARELADFIGEQRAETGKPVIIAAHHFHAIFDIVDRVVAVDERNRCLVELDRNVDAIRAFFDGEEPTRHEDTAAEGHPSGVAVPSGRPRLRMKWLAWYFGHYFRELVFCPTALLYMAVGAALSGFVSTWFLFQNFPHRDLLVPVLHDNTLQALGFVQFRILVPLMTALLLAARNSALVSAEIGHREKSEQLLAMRNLAIPYYSYLLGNILLNMVIACLFFTALNALLCAAVSMFTWGHIFTHQSTGLWKDVYYTKILGTGRLPIGLGWVACKMVLSGLAIGAFAWGFGISRKESVVDINKGIARAIIWATGAILVIHAVFAFLEV